MIPRSIKRVAIIGAGTSGLACAKECREQGLNVQIFEQSNHVGGIWALDSIPQELQQLDVFSDGYLETSTAILSSIYENLRVNLPRQVMGFVDFPFDSNFPGSKDSRQFCNHDEVTRYIKAYVEHFQLLDLIQFNSNVTDVAPSESNPDGWNLEVVCGTEKSVLVFDAVVVANGHYTKPHLATIKNIHLFKRPCLHSHLYRRPQPFAEKSVALLGNSVSGHDLAADIATVAREVYLCGRSWRPAVDLKSAHGSRHNIRYCGNIEESPGEGQLKLADGEVLKSVDVLVFCTGYEYDFPFLENTGLVSTADGIVYPLYKDIFHPLHPTLAFVGLMSRNTPFPVAEYQSKYIARVLLGRCRLPDSQTMMSAIDQTLSAYEKENGSLKKYFCFLFRQYPYINDLIELCGDVPPLAGWRQKLHELTIQVKKQNLDDSKDLELQDQSTIEAEQEFAALRLSIDK